MISFQAKLEKDPEPTCAMKEAFDAERGSEE